MLKNFATRLDDRLLKKFRTLVLQKHNSLYRHMNDEIGRALDSHIRKMEMEIDKGR